jgi:hypothetical protein
MWLVCDSGYGFPKEVRPRQEKLYAISRQLVNFLVWQQQQSFDSQQTESPQQLPARLLIVLGMGEGRTRTSTTTTLSDAATIDPVSSVAKGVACSHKDANIIGTASVVGSKNELHTVLLDRMHEVWNQQQVVNSKMAAFPNDRVVFTYDTLPEAIDELQRQRSSATTQTPLTANFETIAPAAIDSQPPLAVKDGLVSDVGATVEKPVFLHCAGDGCDIDDTADAGSSVVYLSPDAQDVLDVAAIRSPHIVIVGMLIDRRTIQVHRSNRRAQSMVIPTARWPLEQCATATAVVNRSTLETGSDQNASSTTTTSQPLVQFHPNEPLNVDCVLEGMQRWNWNCSRCRHDDQDKGSPLILAIQQALRHHQQRHPQRVRHKELDNNEVSEMSNRFSRAKVS